MAGAFSRETSFHFVLIGDDRECVMGLVLRKEYNIVASLHVPSFAECFIRTCVHNYCSNSEDGAANNSRNRVYS